MGMFERSLTIHELQRTYFYVDEDGEWRFQIGGRPLVNSYRLRPDAERIVLDHGRGVYRIEFRDQEFPTMEAMVEAGILQETP